MSWPSRAGSLCPAGQGLCKGICEVYCWEPRCSVLSLDQPGHQYLFKNVIHISYSDIWTGKLSYNRIHNFQCWLLILKIILDPLVSFNPARCDKEV